MKYDNDYVQCKRCRSKVDIKPIKIVYNCSDFARHEHKYKWVAELCSLFQFLLRGLFYGKEEM